MITAIHAETAKTGARYMAREPLPDRRHTWRQKVHILDANSGVHKFYVEFGEYPDGRLAEIFITAQKTGTFVRGTLDSLAQSISVALQSGTSPSVMARQLRGQDYPPQGAVMAEGSLVVFCTSIADYIGREIAACYGEDGRRLNGGVEETPPAPDAPGKTFGHTTDAWRTHA